MTLGSHQKAICTSQVHITPRWIIDGLAPFGLDPCAANPRPWDCAKANSGAPPVLVAFGDYDATRLRQFASVHGGALVEKWQLFWAASLFSEAAE
jgi:hypothetical protein